MEKEISTVKDTIDNKPFSSEEEEEQIVLFQYKRPYNQSTYDSFKIHTKRIKPNLQTQQAALQSKKHNFLDSEQMLNNMFKKLQLTSHKPQESKSDSNEKATIESDFFLKKIELNPCNSDEIPFQQFRKNAILIKELNRRSERENKFNKLRGMTKDEKISRRIKYKIVPLTQQNFVCLNGQTVEYENLCSQMTSEELKNYDFNKSTAYEYYILQKGKLGPEVGSKSIMLPQQLQNLLEKYQSQVIDDQPQNSAYSESDSNCQDRSEYDYPDEQDDSSEGVIQRQYDQGQSQDEQQYYRRYLQRCKRQGNDDEIDYLYNLKPTDYDEQDY